jgi:hypothetical protein
MEMARRLINLGVDPLAITEEAVTALSQAEEQRHESMVALLREYLPEPDRGEGSN